jgi:hypothetical protein
VYTADEKGGMHPALYAGGARKVREGDPLTRRFLVEGLLLLAATRKGRQRLRAARVYPVIKALHEALDAEMEERSAARHADSNGANSASNSGSSSRAAAAGVMVGSDSGAAPVAPAAAAIDMDAVDDDISSFVPSASSAPVPRAQLVKSGTSSSDDEATVEAINRLMQQLFRDDEVKHTTEVTGRNFEAEEAAAAASKSRSDATAPKLTSAAAARKDDISLGSEQTQPTGKVLYSVMPKEAARAAAAEVSKGADVGADELASLVTPGLPGWEDE